MPTPGMLISCLDVSRDTVYESREMAFSSPTWGAVIIRGEYFVTLKNLNCIIRLKIEMISMYIR